MDLENAPGKSGIHAVTRNGSPHSDWVLLVHQDQIDSVIERSRKHPVIIYKHSYRCGICYNVQKQLKNNWDRMENKTELYFADVIRYRNVSDKIADVFGIAHESPQILIIYQGKVLYTESHYAINIEQIIKRINI